MAVFQAVYVMNTHVIHSSTQSYARNHAVTGIEAHSISLILKSIVLGDKE